MEEVKDKEGKVIAYDLTLDASAEGEEIKIHLTTLQNVYGTIACLNDEAQYKYDLANLIVNEVEDAVDQKLIKNASPFVKGAAKKVGRMSTSVEIKDGSVWTLRDAKINLIKTKLAARQAASKMRQLDKAIGTAQSLLAWERAAYQNS